jgi:hypothetical protein
MAHGTRSARRLAPADVRALRQAASRFGGDAAARKADLLHRAVACAIDRPRVLLDFRDTLRFLLAYPETPMLYRAALQALARVDALAVALPAAALRSLAGTGVPGSAATATPTLDIARWLAHRHPGAADIDAFGDDGRPLAGVLALALPPLEAELTAADQDSLRLLDEAKGRAASRLAFLVDAIDAIDAAPAVRGLLFESLAPHVTIRAGGTLARAVARGIAAAPYCHVAPLEKTVADPRDVMNEPLPPPRPLSTRQRSALIDTARATLAVLARETDPLTWPSRDGVTLYELARGASVALYPMDPARRFALDSHTGYLLMKNGVPVAYGGGWPFLATCRTGINVFPAFRGGESSWLFAQVLRVYHHHFGVARFVVEPYQFGAGNREGLLSGAFWMYYRLGFRPVERPLRGVAATEFEHIRKVSGYRSPLRTMRALAASDLALDLAPTDAAMRVDAGALSLEVSRHVGEAHRGDRRAAAAAAVRRVVAALGVGDRAGWPAAEARAFRSLAQVVARIPDLDAWTRDQRAACVALMRAKGAADDAPYFRALVAHRRLAEGLLAVLRGH